MRKRIARLDLPSPPKSKPETFAAGVLRETVGTPTGTIYGVVQREPLTTKIKITRTRS